MIWVAFLSLFIAFISERTNAAEALLPKDNCTTACNKAIDLFLAIDVSASLNPVEMADLRQFVTNFLPLLSIAPGDETKVELAISFFWIHQGVILPYTDDTTIAKAQQVIDEEFDCDEKNRLNILVGGQPQQYPCGPTSASCCSSHWGTSISLGVIEAAKYLATNPAKRVAAPVIITLTDGCHNTLASADACTGVNPETGYRNCIINKFCDNQSPNAPNGCITDIKNTMKKARDMLPAAQWFAVYVARDTCEHDNQLLNTIADPGNVYYVNDTKMLPALAKDVVNDVCNSQPGPGRCDTIAPTTAPTPQPSNAPTNAPSRTPTTAPTTAPTNAPTSPPTNRPTPSPTSRPTSSPTPIDLRTDAPTNDPRAPLPTDAPTPPPTDVVTGAPTSPPTDTPAPTDTPQPTDIPTEGTPRPTNTRRPTPPIAPTLPPPPTFAPPPTDIPCPGTCDDGNACTVDRCLPNGNCNNVPIQCLNSSVFGEGCTLTQCNRTTGTCTNHTNMCPTGEVTGLSAGAKAGIAVGAVLGTAGVAVAALVGIKAAGGASASGSSLFGPGSSVLESGIHQGALNAGHNPMHMQDTYMSL